MCFFFCPVIDLGIYGIPFYFIFYSDVATDEVNHLFAAADADQDDRLSYNEILDNYDLFVGSEATDYGDHLQNIDKFRDEL